MSNVLRKEKKQEVIALGRLGWTLRRIEEATGVRRETASGYLKDAGIAVRAPGWQNRGSVEAVKGVGSDWQAKPAIEVIPDSEAKPAMGVTPDFIRVTAENRAILLPPAPMVSLSQCEPFRETIEEALRRGRNGKSIWQDLVDQYGFAGDYQSVKRFVRQLCGSSGPQPAGIIITDPAQEMQVDYGTGPMVRDPGTGKYRRTRLLVLTLGYSRKSIRLLTFKSSSRIWAELHETAFRRLGGCARLVVLDNLKEGVLKPDIYDPTLNPLFRDMLAHYGVVAMPCRVRNPDRKGKVESGVGHAQKTPLKGQRFESLEEAQTYLDNWEARWADTRIHGTTKRQVAAMFAEEKPFLLALPIEPFRYYQYGERIVHLDGCVEVEAAYYSTPPGWIGKLVYVQWDSLHVRILDPKPKADTDPLLREHVRQTRGRHRIRPEDNLKKTPFTTVHLLARAARAGAQIGTFCEALHHRHGELGVRGILGVLSLAKKFGVVAVEDACAAALELHVYEYRFIRRYLERHPQPTLRQIDPLIRELTQYRDLINLKAQEQNHECD
jgi:transposase